MPTVKITDLTDALEMVPDESSAWLDHDTGQIHIIQDRLMAIATGDSDDDPEDSDTVTDWDDAELARARELCSRPDRAIALPTAFDFHEYRHMERFIESLPESAATDQLWRAIKGRGAFRHFKDTADRLGVLDAWYAYRDNAARQFMLDWAADNHVAVDESPGRRGP